MSMRRPKVMTIVGTRPEVIKMSRVIAELERVSDHVLVHSGQNYDYELNQVFFDELGLAKPQHFLGAAGGTAAETIATVIARADEVMAEEAPDAMVLYGDTNTCLAVIPAKRRHIPVFHLEAGNRCFDDRVPEEVNRRVVDHLSDVNMALTEHARRYLLAEGIRPETVFKIGSPIKEVYGFHREAIEASDVLDRLALKKGRFLLVSAHREENVDDPSTLHALMDCLLALASAHDVPVVVSTHPRTRERLDRLDHHALAARDVRFMRPFGYLDYVHLQSRALCVVSDSGTLTEESAPAGFSGGDDSSGTRATRGDGRGRARRYRPMAGSGGARRRDGRGAGERDRPLGGRARLRGGRRVTAGGADRAQLHRLCPAHGVLRH